MPGVWLARSLVRKSKKAHELVTTGPPKRSGIPCAMALRLIPRSLRRSGFFVTVPAQCEALSRVYASVEALRPRGFVVREVAHSSCAPSAAIASRAQRP
jgi:hypothetical protein